MIIHEYLEHIEYFFDTLFECWREADGGFILYKHQI